MSSKQKYLIVEDSFNVCQGIKERVDDYTHWLCCPFAHHVEDALNLIKENHPSLIFLDWSLKGGSAYEVLQFIENCPNYDPYIIFNTGYQSENPEIPQEIMNSYKIDKYLIKPIWENLRLNLTKYLTEAEYKINYKNRIKTEIWLADITKKKHHVNLQDLVCIVQCYHNPYYKELHFANYGPLIIKTSWSNVISMLNNYKIVFFVINSRAYIVVKNHIQDYERPFVRMKNSKIKIEVVREKLCEFEKWIETV
jgi:two-component system LytT family response regulator